MTVAKIDRYRRRLEEIGRQLTGTSRTLENETRRASSGESAGGLSNVPMHLGDVASETFAQELSSTLLENEEFIGKEVGDALTRIEKGAFGVCEECKESIPTERLDILPYARYCVPCSTKLQLGGDANMNAGRPTDWGSSFESPESHPRNPRANEGHSTSGRKAKRSDDDLHAAGTPGGGTGIGGLAGANSGDGEPDDDQLDDAMGSGRFDVADEADEPETNDAYSGQSGGAIGGSPANKRSVGGKRRTNGPKASEK